MFWDLEMTVGERRVVVKPLEPFDEDSKNVKCLMHLYPIKPDELLAESIKKAIGTALLAVFSGLPRYDLEVNFTGMTKTQSEYGDYFQADDILNALKRIVKGPA